MRRNESETSTAGNALVELAIVLPILFLILFATYETVAFLRNKQLAQVASREGAVRAYRKCSNFRDPSTTQLAQLQLCFGKVADEIRRLPGAAGATVNLGLYRCLPAGEPGCTPQLFGEIGNGLSSFTNILTTSGDPFTTLVKSQEVVVVSQVQWTFIPVVGSSSFFNRFRFMQISDASIL